PLPFSFGSATQRFLLPWLSAVHASKPLAGAAVRLTGNGTLNACCMVKLCAHNAGERHIERNAVEQDVRFKAPRAEANIERYLFKLTSMRCLGGMISLMSLRCQRNDAIPAVLRLNRKNLHTAGSVVRDV